MPDITEIINNVIKERRSIYPNMYTGEPVPDVIIKQMLENANWAPTHKITEPWRFIVFTGDGLKKLADFQSELYKNVTIKDGSFKENVYEKLSKKPLSASHVIAIGMARDSKKSLPEVEEISAVAAAVQNMYLTAAAYKVGVYWGTGGVTYFPEAKPFFGLGKDDLLMGFLYLGIPKSWPDGRRTPVEEKITWVTEE